jgi:hypothetical protein
MPASEYFPAYLRATLAKVEQFPATSRDVERALQQHALTMAHLGRSEFDAIRMHEEIEMARTSLIATLETLCETEEPTVLEQPATSPATAAGDDTSSAFINPTE